MLVNPAQSWVPSVILIPSHCQPCWMERGYLPGAKPLKNHLKAFKSTHISLEGKACSPYSEYILSLFPTK